ncbi:hypothetical protein DL768_007647 [Monosporascus sp. mg162]|nr:hypothetical protein DL768_007647 [Monosporascus sp. mg162]
MLVGGSAFFHNGSAKREAAVNPSLDVARWDSSSVVPRANKLLPIPPVLPAQTPRAPQPRNAESSIYPYLETNANFLLTQFSEAPISGDKTELSVSLHDADMPFRPYSVMQRYVQGLVNGNGYQDFPEYSSAAERVEKVGDEWKVTLRKGGEHSDYWGVGWFDAAAVASGHYWVPYVPHTDGFEEHEREWPGSVLHSKQYGASDVFKGKHVVWRDDLTLLFVGAVGAGFTFKIFELQAVHAARMLAGRGTIPGLEERNTARLAGPPQKGNGRALPPLEKEWEKRFMAGREPRKRMWKKLNAEARENSAVKLEDNRQGARL